MKKEHELSVLVVDQDPRVRWEVSAALLRVGYSSHIVAISTPTTATEVFGSSDRSFDVLVIDPLAFLGEGAELLAQIREHPSGSTIPTIIYSMVDGGHWHTCGYIEKPAAGDILAGAILRCVGLKGLVPLTAQAAQAIALH